MLRKTYSGYSRRRPKEASGSLSQVHGGLGFGPTCLPQNYLRVLAGDETGFERSVFQSKSCGVWSPGSNGPVSRLPLQRLLSFG